MHFTLDEIRELSQFLKNFRISQESEVSRPTLFLIKGAESKLSLALERSLLSSKTTTLELDSDQLNVLKRAISSAREELILKIRQTILLQTTSEAFDNES